MHTDKQLYLFTGKGFGEYAIGSNVQGVKYGKDR